MVGKEQKFGMINKNKGKETMNRFKVVEVADKNNVVMVGIESECQEYCANSNEIMKQDGAQANVFEVIPE